MKLMFIYANKQAEITCCIWRQHVYRVTTDDPASLVQKQKGWNDFTSITRFNLHM